MLITFLPSFLNLQKSPPQSRPNASSRPPQSPLRLTALSCDPHICSATRTAVDPKAIGGATSSPDVPDPKKPKRWKRAVTLALPNHSSLSAFAWEDASGQGSIACDLQPPPAPHKPHHKTSRRRQHLIPIHGPLHPSFSDLVLHNNPPSFQHMHFSLSNRPFHTPMTATPLAWPSVPPKGKAPTAALFPRKSHKNKLNHAHRFRIELKRDAKSHTFLLSRHNSKYGKFDLLLSPRRRILVSFMVKEPLLKRVKRRLALTKRAETKSRGHWKSEAKRHGRGQTIENDSNMRSKRCSRGSNDSKLRKPSERNSAKSGPVVSGMTNPLYQAFSPLEPRPVHKAHVSKSHRHVERRHGSKRTDGRNLSFKSDVEYRWKERGFSLLTGFDAYQAAISLRMRTNPLRLTPRVQVPLGWGESKGVWVCWVHEPGSGLGEVQLGRGGLELSADWQNPRVSLKQKGSNGSLTRISLSKKRVVTIDKTIVTQPILAGSIATIHAHMTTAQNEGSLTATLTGSRGVLSGSASTSRATSLMAEVHMERGRRLYTAGLKIENAKKFAIRLGIFL